MCASTYPIRRPHATSHNPSAPDTGIEDVDNQRESPGYPIDIPTPHKLRQSIALPHPVHDLDRPEGLEVAKSMLAC
jgi:hypothetical protein